jgi:hypothetical protein
MSQLIPLVGFDRVVVCSPKGADPAYAKLGHPTGTWPPRRPWRDQLAALSGVGEDRHANRPQVWRIERPYVPGLAEYAKAGELYGAVLKAALKRGQAPPDSLAVLLDDSRVISDPQYMGHGPHVVANMLVGRAKRVSIVNNYQAPRWVPREGLDQATHVLMWKNRDRDVAKRLAEVGDRDPAELAAAMEGLDYHGLLWINGRADELVVIGP